MKKTTVLWMLAFLFLTFGFYACEKDFLQENVVERGKGNGPGGGGGGGGNGGGGNSKDDVQNGELYGDLVISEIDNRGVPVLYPLRYRAEYQDLVIEDYIDVTNPKLSGPFELTVFVRDEDGNLVLEETSGTLVYKKETVTIDPGEDGFLNPEEGEYSPVYLYDSEGEILEGIVDYVYPIEMGRLNSIRSPEDVKEARMIEVIRNFGNGTVATVIKDYCGRLFMIRTDASELEDKPIDSPLENLAIYYELMINGFEKEVTAYGLEFLVQEQEPYGGFDFKSRLDATWDQGAYSYNNLTDEQKKAFASNLAAACMAAASDKFGSLGIDEIVLVNRFLGIPQTVGNDINTPATDVFTFFPYVEQEIRMMNKTNKEQYSKYRYYIDYSFFSYTRNKFTETIIGLCTINYDEDESGNLIIIKEPFTYLSMHEILSGEGVNIEGVQTDRYLDKNLTSGAFGFAAQADDYVQALKAVHDNETYFEWDIGTPTYIPADKSFLDDKSSSPFIYTIDEEEHGNRPEGKGDH